MSIYTTKVLHQDHENQIRTNHNLLLKFSEELCNLTTFPIFPDPNANQFVNQGYNNIEFPQAPQQASRPYVQTQLPQQQAQQSAGTRIIPIQVEGSRSPPNDQTVVMQR